MKPRPLSNPPNPWERTVVEYLREGGADAEQALTGVQVFEDHTKSILAHNDSPDLSFRWSVNPYRGCMHACAYCIGGETPILLAWSAADSPRLVAQGEKLKELLCNSATHCPRTTVLRSRESLASVFGLDASGGSLAEPTLQLVREIEARGLP